MRILHIIEIRGIGGAEKMLLDFLHEQTNVKIEVFCLLIYHTKYVEATEKINFRLLELGVTSYTLEFSNSIDILNLVFKIKKHVQKINPDVIHTHLRLAETLLSIIKLFNKKLIVVTTVHGYSDGFQNQLATGRNFNIRLTFRYYLVRFINFQLNGAAFISDFIMKFYINSHLINNNNKLRRINNAAATNNVEYCDNSIKNININEIQVILPGRLIEWKGHVYAFEAIKILSKKYNISLDCYGTGPYLLELQKTVQRMELQEVVRFKGFTDKIIDVMKLYDIVLIPSLFESFGIVFLDAFASMVPVVAFDLPAGNEIITNQVHGLLAEPYSASSLAEKMEQLILNESIKEIIIGNALHLLKTKYSMSEMVLQYSNFYSDLTGRHIS
jgi:glycosyltransferase involved in cell wall biosynthesis